MRSSEVLRKSKEIDGGKPPYILPGCRRTCSYIRHCTSAAIAARRGMSASKVGRFSGSFPSSQMYSRVSVRPSLYYSRLLSGYRREGPTAEAGCGFSAAASIVRPCTSTRLPVSDCGRGPEAAIVMSGTSRLRVPHLVWAGGVALPEVVGADGALHGVHAVRLPRVRGPGPLHPRRRPAAHRRS